MTIKWRHYTLYIEILEKSNRVKSGILFYNKGRFASLRIAIKERVILYAHFNYPTYKR